MVLETVKSLKQDELLIFHFSFFLLPSVQHTPYPRQLEASSRAAERLFTVSHVRRPITFTKEYVIIQVLLSQPSPANTENKVLWLKSCFDHTE